MKKFTKILTSSLLMATLCTPAFAAPVQQENVILETHTLSELMSDPNVSFMDDNSIISTFATPRMTIYESYIDVGVNASVYGQEREYVAGFFGSDVYNIQCDPYENSGTLTVSLCEVDFWDNYNILVSNSQAVNDNITSRSYNFSTRYPSGDYAFQYTTKGSLALYADVTMYSE